MILVVDGHAWPICMVRVNIEFTNETNCCKYIKHEKVQIELKTSVHLDLENRFLFDQQGAL